VIRNKTAAVDNKVNERLIHFRIPTIAVVIHNDDVVLTEVDVEFAEIPTLLWRRCNVNSEDPGVFKDFNEVRRGRLPIVVVLTRR